MYYSSKSPAGKISLVIRLCARTRPYIQSNTRLLLNSSPASTLSESPLQPKSVFHRHRDTAILSSLPQSKTVRTGALQTPGSLGFPLERTWAEKTNNRVIQLETPSNNTKKHATL